jgi:hypothetical protein
MGSVTCIYRRRPTVNAAGTILEAAPRHDSTELHFQPPKYGTWCDAICTQPRFSTTVFISIRVGEKLGRHHCATWARDRRAPVSTVVLAGGCVETIGLSTRRDLKKMPQKQWGWRIGRLGT